MSNLELVQICADGEARASTEVLAVGFDVPQDAMLRLLRRYLPHIETLGNCAFEMRNSTAGTGRPTKDAFLNERQACFLMTLMRNTKQVVDFKLQLAHEFWRITRALENHDISALQRRLKLQARDQSSLA